MNPQRLVVAERLTLTDEFLRFTSLLHDEAHLGATPVQDPVFLLVPDAVLRFRARVLETAAASSSSWRVRAVRSPSSRPASRCVL